MRDGKVSPYRMVLVATLAAFGWALWAGWVQWAVLGEGMADAGHGPLRVDIAIAFGIFLARWVLVSWLVSVLLWPWVVDKDDILGWAIVPPLIICLIGTIVQVAIVHEFTPFPPQTHYRAVVSCEHCEASCNVLVKIGESWTDWPGITCCRCGITILAEKVPEYAKTREAWDARVHQRGGT